MACTKLQVLTPQGEDGEKGDPGMGAYETWLSLLDKGEYPDWKGGRSEADFLIFLSGKDGQNGLSAYHEWKNMVAKGDVPDPHNQGKMWDPQKNTERDFFLFLTGAKGDKGDTGAQGDKGDAGAKGDKGDTGAKGDKGDTGAQGDKGDTGAKGDKGDTGVKGDKGDTGVQGDKGDTGAKGDTGVNGTNGASGADGQSAYVIWKNMAEKGDLPNPHPALPGYTGQFWPKDKVALEDFWVYLRGENGQHTKEVIADYILSFQPVQLQQNGVGYNAVSGDAVLRLTDRNTKPVAAGTKVLFGTAFGLPAAKEYTVGSDGTIQIPRADLLPNGTDVSARTGRATLTIGGKTEQTNLFVFPTQVKFEGTQWSIYNDWGAGVVRAQTQSKYYFDPAGSLAVVEIDRRVKEKTYLQVYNEWINAQNDQTILFQITDRTGTVLAQETDPRVADAYYARQDGTPVARRPLFFKTGDTHKLGWLFANDNGRIFSNDPYYVRTKPINKYFGISGQIQSPVIEVPAMPRIPLLKNIKMENGKAVGEFEELESIYQNKYIGSFSSAPGEPGLYVAEERPFPANFALNIVITKVNLAYTGTAYMGNRGFEFTVSTNASDLVGCQVFLSGPQAFTPVTANGIAYPMNQQPWLRPVKLGTIELDGAGRARIKYSTDLGMTDTYVPLKD